MNFCTIRDLRTNSKKIWGKDDVIITNNGKPKAVLIKTDEESFINTLSLIASARAEQAVKEIRRESKNKGYFTDEEIDEEIKAVRKKK
ncbi:MAG: type II toxin-antitoxin system Phd/YefM family antitoxin [Lachnospiraceae bacterium]|nr:type II toxin-antitoxin system Phd/YefM family antitoxin [Lachnospiraceae bacterium]